MAGRFAESFAHLSMSQIGRKWSGGVAVSSGLGSLDPINSFPGSYGCYASDTNNNEKLRIVLDAQATWIVCVRYKLPTIAGARSLVTFRDSAGNEQCSLRQNASGNLLFTRAGTILATSAGTFTAASIINLQLKVTIHNTAGAFEVRVDNTAVLGPSTSQNTRAQTEQSATAISFISDQPGIGVVLSDIVIMDATGGVNDTFLSGTPIVVPSWAREVGNYAQWSGAFADNVANVQEKISDDDGTFNRSSTAGQKDSFGVDNVPSGTVAFVQALLTTRQDGGSQRQIRPFLRISGTDRTMTTFNTPSAYGLTRQILDVSPDTASAFTAAEINAMELGYELIA